MVMKLINFPEFDIAYLTDFQGFDRTPGHPRIPFPVLVFIIHGRRIKDSVAVGRMLLIPG
ncbi:hypothetical protein HanRHA438_Chr05g0236651 [Helianthus annuus]|nr:hypothetical protein HanIR_Chr17g0897481 [Helianthus annuus]KAJ0828394.1 hypothetical protein HanRHA438_Chr17g0836701 [Helianthus annuus]KAJ0920056.1 hypothetical protein HanRHA438_Chr05g0236651 [Helianthus annuus]